jgi:MFS family permease
MQFQPASTLRSRTYLGLILSQFLAAFNDQAIHASAMFYAIHTDVMPAKKAIFLMPILFYAPWALFCTLAGYVADRYSKRNSLVFWKLAEVGITLVALAGFWLGSGRHQPQLGALLVMSTVFLMGTHSAFFVPAKYGVMPEILQPQLLSKGNGVLESTSFLAVILGTVTGGLLSSWFKDHEYFIGLILVGLALLGAAASFLIRRMPAANPDRPFPRNLVTPLLENLRTLLRSRPLALAVLGIAFFTFMVAFMRCTMYMHGESQNPRWDEWETSLVVATVALGVGLGSPLAGSFSGGKVELGLVPLGAVGMIVAALIAACTIFDLPWLIASLVLIGFFSGFYIVPLYTLLQHRAPKTSKGDLIATSNFINVTGAIAASFLFFILVLLAKWAGVARSIPQEDVLARGTLTELTMRRGHPVYFTVEPGGGGAALARGRPPRPEGEGRQGTGTPAPAGLRGAARHHVVIKVDDDVKKGSAVAVSRYELRGVEHYEVRPADEPLEDAYDEALVPRYLFVGASLMTLAILLVLCRQLPDFFVRSLLWLRSHGRFRLKVVGLKNLPSDGPVILATNCDRFDTCMQVVAATDRFTRFVLLESARDPEPRPLLRYLARRTGLVALRPGLVTPAQWDKALGKASRTLQTGNLLGLTVDGDWPPAEADKFLHQLRSLRPAVILPVYCGALHATPSVNGRAPAVRRVRVVIGYPLRPDATAADVRQAIRALGDWIQQTEQHTEALPAALVVPRA